MQFIQHCIEHKIKNASRAVASKEHLIYKGLVKLVNNEKLHLRCGEQYQPSGFIERDFLFGSDEDFKFIAYNMRL